MRKDYFILTILAVLAILMLGLPIEMMEVDATQYASISMEMSQNGSFLEVLHRGRDYLDKPPLLFWTSALSFKIFGLNPFGYKFFSFIAMLIGAYSVFQFTKLFYSLKASQIASLFYCSNIAVLLITNDVRTDTILMGWCAFSVWMSAAYIQKKRMIYLIGFGIGIGLALLSKGPIGLMLPVSALGVHLIATQQWEKIFDLKWAIALFTSLFIIAPMVWGLYQQFDLHPEKMVNGKTGVSGIYFYFWEQSFGRLTGESVWKDDSGYGYFLHTFIWAFIPWIFAFLFALFQSIKDVYQVRKIHLREYFSISAIVVPFLALSLSHYKLPHYIFIVIPFASIFSAQFIERCISSPKLTTTFRWLSIMQWSLLVLGLILSIFISGWAFPNKNILYWILLITAFALPIYVHQKSGKSLLSFLSVGVSTFVIVGLTMNMSFYPNLMTYQASSQVGKYIIDQKIPASDVFTFRTHGHALDFNVRAILHDLDSVDEVTKQVGAQNQTFIYTNETGYEELKRDQIDFSITHVVPHFKVTKLSFKFLNPNTRENTFEKAYLLKMIHSTD